jgi:hypothetical protein
MSIAIKWEKAKYVLQLQYYLKHCLNRDQIPSADKLSHNTSRPFINGVAPFLVLTGSICLCFYDMEIRSRNVKAWNPCNTII